MQTVMRPGMPLADYLQRYDEAPFEIIDGMVVPMIEHYGVRMYQIQWKSFSPQHFQKAQNKLRTAPLWGIRFRNRMMHDGQSITLRDAILRHRKEGREAAKHFKHLSAADQQAVLDFVNSL